MASIHKKAVALMRDLTDRLKIRLSSLTFTSSFDSSGSPTLAIGSGTAGQQNFFLRILEMPSIGTNAVGNTQDSYGPHIIQLAMETSSVASVALDTEANKLAVLGEALRLGTRLDLYLSANGTAPTLTSVGSSATVTATFEGLYHNPQINM